MFILICTDNYGDQQVVTCDTMEDCWNEMWDMLDGDPADFRCNWYDAKPIKVEVNRNPQFRVVE